MKYKLINALNKQETLCDKVTINGFDYYVSDEIIEKGWEGTAYKKDIKDKIFKHFYTTNKWYKDAKKIIATTNPNIDIPKVVDEVEELADKYVKGQPIRNRSLSNDGCNATGFVNGYNKSKETHPFSADDMIDFGEWVDNMGYTQVANGLFKSLSDENGKSTKELLQLWEEQQPKIIYYKKKG